jgi:hypothetical protein
VEDSLLARVSHQLSTAAADPGICVALCRAPRRTVEYACVALGRAGQRLPDAPCIHARLRLLAAKPGEKSWPEI